MLSISSKAVAGLEVVTREEGGYGHRFFAFELHAVEGEAALAGGDSERFVLPVDDGAGSGRSGGFDRAQTRGQDFQPLVSQPSVGGRPGMKGADATLNADRAMGPVDLSVFFFQ